jgi:serine phosphatase RsbU (regulator of sigma subunit)
MSPHDDLIHNLSSLNHIAETLNQAVDVRSVLDDALADLVQLMGLETAWILLDQAPDGGAAGGAEYVLAAHHNLPPALDADNRAIWSGPCTCCTLCRAGRLAEAYNEVRCSRLGHASGDRWGLSVHASAPLRAGEQVLGILNVAAPDWASFSPQALSLLTHVGSQIGVALERAQLYDLLRSQRVQEQAALLQFSNRLLGRLDFDELMHWLADEARKMLRADASSLLLPGADPGRLEFRAASGWRVDPSLAQRQVPVDNSSGPGQVMQTKQPLLVEDLQASDPTHWRPPWVLSEGFRGHAVVPLLAEGRSIGALVIDQRKPARLPPDDLRFLQLMANQAALAIETARLHQEEVRMQALDKELEVGRTIQLSILPKAPPVVPGWEIAAAYEAARVVGGDFYDVFAFPESPEVLGLAMADVTGKGVPAALFMARGASILRTVALSGCSPADVLQQANSLIMHDGSPELLLSAAFGRLDTTSGRLIFANAGHSRPLWMEAASGRIRELNARGIVLGAFQEIELEECTIDMAPGDVVVLYTDGVTEAMDARHAQFGPSRLERTLAAHRGASARELVNAIVASVRAFAGGVPASDDLALLVLRRMPLPA